MGDMADMVNDGDPDGVLYDYGGDLSCKHCGESELHWVEGGTKRNPTWRLADEDGHVHSCQGTPSQIDRGLGFDWSSLRKKGSK